jgi:hypothetical protein
MMTAKQFETKLVQSLIYKPEKGTLFKNVKIKVMSEKPSLSIRKANQIAKIWCSLTRLVLKND